MHLKYYLTVCGAQFCGTWKGESTYRNSPRIGGLAQEHSRDRVLAYQAGDSELKL
jgi:hypothetical protein